MKMSAPAMCCWTARQHLLGAFDIDALDTARRRDLHRPAHEYDVRTGFARRFGDRVAHLSGAAIADEAHRIDPLARRAGRDDDLQALQHARCRRAQ